MSRLNTLTQKVPTKFGSLYAHVSHDPRDPAGRVIEVAFSTPGKFDNSAVSDAVVALGAATTAMIDSIQETTEQQT